MKLLGNLLHCKERERGGGRKEKRRLEINARRPKPASDSMKCNYEIASINIMEEGGVKFYQNCFLLR